MPDTTITIWPNNLDLKSIRKIEVIEKDKKRTKNSTVIGVLVGSAGISALAIMFFLVLFH